MVMIPLSDLFDIRYGHSLELNRLRLLDRTQGGIPFVSRKMGDNGISAYVARISGEEPAAAGQLSCALGGNGVLSTFLQELPFYSGRDVAHLAPQFEMTKPQLLYYCAVIVANRYRFSYGRQANRTLKNILVPCLSEIPDFIEKTDVARFEGCDKASICSEPDDLATFSWQLFVLGELFEVKKGKRLTKANMKPGQTPFIGSTDSNNGITARVEQCPIHAGNTISLSYNGSVAEAFYQPFPFWATDDVNVLYPRFDMTPAIALFLCTVIRQEKYRYNYGRKWHLERMRESVIKLPVTPTGDPDWPFMEHYIKTLPYSSQVGETAA
jgi:hypothetical protein